MTQLRAFCKEEPSDVIVRDGPMAVLAVGPLLGLLRDDILAKRRVPDNKVKRFNIFLRSEAVLVFAEKVRTYQPLITHGGKLHLRPVMSRFYLVAHRDGTN